MAEHYRSGRKLPDRFRNPPQLGLGLEFTYGAFSELSTCRAIGFGLGQIPWWCIKEYANTYSLPTTDFEDFLFLIRAMDNAYLAYNAAQMKKAAKDKSAGGSGA